MKYKQARRMSHLRDLEIRVFIKATKKTGNYFIYKWLATEGRGVLWSLRK